MPSLMYRFLNVAPFVAKALLAAVDVSITRPPLAPKVALPVSLKVPAMLSRVLVDVKLAVPEMEKLPPMLMSALFPENVPLA